MTERDEADIAVEFVADAIFLVPRWEVRADADDPMRCWVERGVGADTERFVDVPLSYLDACKVERLLGVARGE